MADLTGKRILITGATAGIGKAVLDSCRLQGASGIIACGRDQLKMTAISDVWPPDSPSALIPFLGDLTITDNTNALIKLIEDHSIKLDGAIYCAGLDKAMPFQMAQEKIFQDLFKINVTVPLDITRTLLKKNLINPGSSIIFLSSVMGFLGQPGQVAYCASKGALISAAKALALELASKKIRINTLAPGIVRTELTTKLFNSLPKEAVENITRMHPLGLGEPSDVANIASFLFSDEARWITGSTFVVDGGYSAQ